MNEWIKLISVANMEMQNSNLIFKIYIFFYKYLSDKHDLQLHVK